MAVLHMNTESIYLKGNQEFTMILPDCPQDATPRSYYEHTGGKAHDGKDSQGLRCVWLLHGTFGDHTDWLRKTNVERYAIDRNIAVVMPSGQNSNFSNWDQAMMGYGVRDYILEELMPLVHSWFPVSPRREDNFIAGLSMGGRATIKFATGYPERFAAAAALSASPKNFDEILTPDYLNSTDVFAQRVKGMIANVGGLETFLGSEENVWRVIDDKVPTGVLPRMLFATGAEDDYVVPDLRIFQAHAEKIGMDAEFIYEPGLAHEWDFWDIAVRYAFDFFGLEKVNR